MAVMNGCRSAKRARRCNRISADLYDFSTFPSDHTNGGDSTTTTLPPFRDVVRTFLATHARVTFPPSTLLSSLMTWQIMLRPGVSTDGASDLSSKVVSLDVVEEDVTRSSRSVYCDHCRVVGWSSHPLCRKRYHFIIRSRGDTKACSRCGITQNFSEGSNCKWCSLALDIEDWVYSQLKTTLTSFTVSSIPTALLISCLSTGGKVALFFLLVVPLWTFGTGLQKKKTYKVDACSLLDLVVEWIRELKSPSPRAVLSQINPLVSNVPNDSVAIPLQILPLL